MPEVRSMCGVLQDAYAVSTAHVVTEAKCEIRLARDVLQNAKSQELFSVSGPSIDHQVRPARYIARISVHHVYKWYPEPCKHGGKISNPQ